ncbi:hypothetical protein CPLU01_08749 [Colletotrichum plurivorum]|uniref:C2H2-type domain-containing protein n=1 Tax=Colletotrichum plurivorum TaxID=2175906 RepID=A0A8H6KC63_9PEZI|nr:hypothetical protein CPLU01_08749 [Colletotrichum plurivorum]
MSNNPPQAPAPGLDKAWTIAQRNVEQRRRRGVQPKECPLCNGQLRTDTRDELQRHFDRHHPLETDTEAAVSERKALIDDTFEK